MAEERYRVGQLVRLKVGTTLDAPDLYQVVHILEGPSSGDVQYRLRGIHEPHERHVRDHQISSATMARTVPSERTVTFEFALPPSACVPPASQTRSEHIF
jgi:hypothetical protein